MEGTDLKDDPSARQTAGKRSGSSSPQMDYPRPSYVPSQSVIHIATE
jgi:hypothetical protein